MLDGFLGRDEINVCRAPNGSKYRLKAMMTGEIEATTLTERTQLQLQTAWEFLYMGRTPEAIEGFLSDLRRES